jgi:pilus assembly protein Flp/PilA
MFADAVAGPFTVFPGDFRGQSVGGVNHIWERFGRRHERRVHPDEPLQRDALLTKEWAMSRLMQIIRSQRGATAIEYALVGALISIAALAAMTTLGGKVNTMFNNVSNHM